MPINNFNEKHFSLKKCCCGHSLHIIADLAELCDQQFCSKNNCDAIKDFCRHFNEKSFALMCKRSELIFDATNFFGKILTKQKSALNSEVLLQKCNRAKQI